MFKNRNITTVITVVSIKLWKIISSLLLLKCLLIKNFVIITNHNKTCKQVSQTESIRRYT